MAQYISKDALVAEIKRRKELVSDPILSGDDLMIGERNAFFNLLSFIDTLEVKEVDLEEEICSFFSKNPIPYEHITDWPLLKNCAIHFFELGIKAQKGE